MPNLGCSYIGGKFCSPVNQRQGPLSPLSLLEAKMRKSPFLSITLLSWNTEFPPPSLPPSLPSLPFLSSVTDFLCAPKCTSCIAALSPGLIIASHCLSLPASFSSYPYPGPVPSRVKARGRTPRLCLLPQVCPALGLVLGGIFRNRETHCCLQGPGLCMRCRQLTIRQGRDCTVTSEISLRPWGRRR